MAKTTTTACGQPAVGLYAVRAEGFVPLCADHFHQLRRQLKADGGEYHHAPLKKPSPCASTEPINRSQHDPAIAAAATAEPDEE